MTHLLPCDVYLWCSTWMGLNRYFYHLFTWWNCLSLYLWTLSAEKSCGRDCKSLAELFIASCILMQIYSVISPSWCAWIVAFLSLVPRLSQHKAMFTYLKQSQTSQCQTIPYHFSQSINHPSPNLHLSFVNHDLLCRLRQYNGRHGSNIYYFFCCFR